MNFNSLNSAAGVASTAGAASSASVADAAQPAAGSPGTAAGAGQAQASSSTIDGIVAQLQALAGSVEFSVDKAAGMQVITIRDPKSGDVIRQLPSEEALKVARQLANGQGGLINRSA